MFFAAAPGMAQNEPRATPPLKIRDANLKTETATLSLVEAGKAAVLASSELRANPDSVEGAVAAQAASTARPTPVPAPQPPARTSGAKAPLRKNVDGMKEGSVYSALLEMAEAEAAHERIDDKKPAAGAK